MNRQPISELLRKSQSFLFDRAQRMKYSTAEKQSNDWLKKFIIDNGEVDENGHKVVYFPEPLTIGEITYTGLTARRNITPYLKTDEIETWLTEHGMLDEIREEVPATFYYDWDQVYILNQEGKIPDEVIDSFEDNRVTWSLWPRE